MQREFNPGSKMSGYSLVKKVGEGITSFVYSGTSFDNRQVIIKCVRKDESWVVRQYEKEIKALRSFRHIPQIVNILDHFDYGNTGVLVLQPFDMDLQEYIENATIPSRHAKEMFMQVCTAVQVLHHNNFAHLDIKPENIFLNDRNSLTLGDFGSCFQWSEDNPKKIGVCGTKYYCAPEVVRISCLSLPLYCSNYFF